MTDIKHSSVVTSEALSVLSKLKTPITGLDFLQLEFCKLDEKVKDTVADQFVRHANKLKGLDISGSLLDLSESDKVNVAEFAATILEAQEEINMKLLFL